MAKRRNGSVDNIDDLIYYAKKAGYDSIVEKAENIKLFLDVLKESKADAKMSFQEFLDLKEGDKYILIYFYEDDYESWDIEEKAEVNIENKTIEIFTSNGDFQIEFKSLEDKIDKVYDCSNDYQYSIYSLKTRKKKITKLLENN